MKGVEISVQKQGGRSVVCEPQESLPVDEVQSFLEIFGNGQGLDEVGDLALVDQGDPDTRDTELLPDFAQETLEEPLEVQDREDADLDLEELLRDLFVVSDSFQDAFYLGKIPEVSVLISLCRHALPSLRIHNQLLCRILWTLTAD